MSGVGAGDSRLETRTGGCLRSGGVKAGVADPCLDLNVGGRLEVALERVERR